MEQVLDKVEGYTIVLVQALVLVVQRVGYSVVEGLILDNFVPVEQQTFVDTLFVDMLSFVDYVVCGCASVGMYGDSSATLSFFFFLNKFLSFIVLMI